ncbi:MAG: cupin domain-containing protein, partial [Kangiellaceae bacterium]|nr:cupin domain-containing protein [Kangiellaceae bacterium]
GDLQTNVTIIPGLCHQPDVNPVIDVIMQPGDVLYIPPETAHWGESIGESIGYSVGYRSPQTRDIFALLANFLDGSSENSFFDDSYRSSPNPTNKIEPELVDWASEKIRNIADNQELVSIILSRFLSESKIDTVQFGSKSKITSIENILSIQLVNGINCNWLEIENEIVLSIEGESIHFPYEFKPAIKTLCSGEELEISGLQPLIQKFDFSESLSSLVNKGYFLVKD